MGLKPNFSIVELSRQVNEAKEQIKLASLQTLRFVGEDFVKNAREAGQYTDRTSNLRNSIGYVIFVDGDVYLESFEGNADEGRAQGKKVAGELAQNFADFSGYVLLVISGMLYSAAVESKGFDVLTSSSMKAEDLLKESFARIKNRNG